MDEGNTNTGNPLTSFPVLLNGLLLNNLAQTQQISNSRSLLSSIPSSALNDIFRPTLFKGWLRKRLLPELMIDNVVFILSCAHTYWKSFFRGGGHRSEGWKMRFFVLKGKTLFYYASDVRTSGLHRALSLVGSNSFVSFSLRKWREYLMGRSICLTFTWSGPSLRESHVVYYYTLSTVAETILLERTMNQISRIGSLLWALWYRQWVRNWPSTLSKRE